MKYKLSEFGCTPLAVNMGSECLAETGLSGQAQISLGTVRDGSTLPSAFAIVLSAVLIAVDATINEILFLKLILHTSFIIFL